jgi:hypothetical protein
MYDRQRIRRPHAERPSLAARQTARVPDADAKGSGIASAGHSFGRVAVTAPTSWEERVSTRHAFIATIPVEANRQADGDRDDGKQAMPPLVEDQGVDVPALAPTEDETDALPLGGGASGATQRLQSALGFTSSRTDEPVNPPGGEYGTTTFKALPLKDVEVKTGKRGFTLKATEELEIEVQVCPGNGPHHEINIAGDADPAINSGNYLKVAADLTPDPKDHVPPRNHYWARDLVYNHEHFHATEDATYGAEGTRQAQGWLNKQRAKDEQAVQTLLDLVPGQVEEHVRVKMPKTDREQRAYDDGAQAYQALADAIKAKGDSGNYPPPP